MNRLKGSVTAIQCSGELSQVDIACGNTGLTAFMLGKPNENPGVAVGSDVWVLFKESEVALAKGFSGALSLRNRFEGRIGKIVLGDLLAEVTLAYAGDTIVSIISRRACEAMELKVGDRVTALVKANEITLMESD
ncbi:TOBE domain-containing protein [Hydrogenimonas cancrithermarum]|uniref:Mop domain-containing protein n=1 Tax=Hydrogenimonas cancrithermarum TaxID=2993563 RepID=A0ABM8FKS3_9BACT|nr:TOBE domain-containing protein [Hydrogenimonas cancrithermarum]BDY12920.1 hypothetical protein HCR_12320 [Hydrogenimonas cancrithermarum]BDY13037.1 hypothetical protein HCR_13490 [Hydrogenimonas cancrithermarum]